jgi:peptidoglycan/LPS O-acetylase OafA/YrhL
MRNPTDSRTLARQLSPQTNSFNLVRLVAALSVIVSHSVLIIHGPGTPQPLSTWTPFTLGQHAVNVFFVISGLTLAGSLDRQGDLGAFARGRFLRIFPGLFVAGLVIALALGPIVTQLNLSAYFEDLRTLTYPFTVLVAFQDVAPPDLFKSLPYGFETDLPLWTIRYEIAAYCGLAGLFAMGLLRRPRVTLVLLALSAAAHVLAAIWVTTGGISAGMAHAAGVLGNVSRFSTSFLLGVVFYQLRATVRLSLAWLALLGIVPVTLDATPLANVAAIGFVGYATIYFGTRSYGALSRWTRRCDVSYGTYLYGWPLQQTLLYLCPTVGIATHTLVSAALAMLAGLLSWTAVEKPALALKRRARETAAAPRPAPRRSADASPDGALSLHELLGPRADDQRTV